MRLVFKQLLAYCLLFMSIIGCVDDDENESFTYSGFLYQNCQKVPFANIELNFYKIVEGSFTNPSGEKIFLGSTTTDNSGYYSFNASCSKIEVRDVSGKFIFGRHCSGKSVYSEIEKTANPSVRFPIKILTDSAYTNSDTIYLYSRTDSFDTTLVGPFANNLIVLTDPIFAHRMVDHANLVVGDSLHHDILFCWGLGMNHFNKVKQMTPPYSPPFYLTNLSHVICGFGDTVVVDLRNI